MEKQDIFDGKNYYEILQINQDANEEEIKKAFKKLAKLYHPDLHPNDQLANAKFQKLNEAYNTLIDPNKRKTYDESLKYGAFDSFFSSNDFAQSDTFANHETWKLSLFERIFLAKHETKKRFYMDGTKIRSYQQWDDFYFQNANQQYVDIENGSAVQNANNFYISFNFDTNLKREFSIYDVDNNLVIGELKILIIERFKQEEQYCYSIWSHKYDYSLDKPQNKILYQVFNQPKQITNQFYDNNMQQDMPQYNNQNQQNQFGWESLFGAFGGFGIPGFGGMPGFGNGGFNNGNNQSAQGNKRSSKRRKWEIALMVIFVLLGVGLAIWRIVSQFIK